MFGYESLNLDLLANYQWLIWPALALLIGLSLWMYRQTNPPINKYLKPLLVALRLVAVLALIAVLLEPVLSYSREFKRQPRVALLTDRSGSMAMVEAGQSRAERIDSLFASTSFANLKDKVKLEPFRFAGELEGESGQLTTARTALGESLEKLNRRLLPEPADFWLLVSDGNSNWGADPLAVAQGLGQPVMTVDAAIRPALFDVGIEQIEHNQVLFAGQKAEVEVKLGWHHAASQSVVVELKAQGRLLGEQRLKIEQETGFSHVKLSFTPTEPGRQMLSVRIRAEGDEEAANNSRAIAVKVLKSKLAILIVSQKPDYELSFLKRFLERSSKYNVDLRVLNRSAGRLAGKFPSRQAELNRFDLLILHDIDPRLLEGSSDLIRSYVRDKGGAVWVQMGESSTRRITPGWLAELMPFYQSVARRVEFYEFHGEPNEDQLFHPVIRLADSRSAIRQAWSEVPPFQMLVPVDQVDPQATILVTAAGRQGPVGRRPVIGFKRTGPGKLMATTASPFWKWDFYSEGYGGDDQKYSLLVEGLISWLTIPEDYDPVRVTPKKEIFTRGEDLRFEGIAYDQGYRPIKGVNGLVKIENDSTGETFEADLIETKEGTYEALMKAIPSGTYRYTGRLEKEGRLLKESKGLVRVEKFSIEEFDSEGRPELLKQLAEMTGGSYVRVDHFDDLLAEIDLAPVIETQAGEASLWDNYWLLMIFVSSLAVEWGLRKFNHLL